MNTTPNPLIPKGTFLEQKGRSHIRLAVFTILAVHVVLLGSLLMAGCKRTTDQAGTEQATNDVGLYPAPPVTQVPTATETSQPPIITEAATGGVAAITNPGPPIPGGPAITGLTADASTLPPAQPEIATPVATPQGEHVVMKGDSFSTIAKKYGVTSRAIQEANPGVEPTRLKIGQKLVIPARTATATTATPTNGASAAAKTYTVKSGDTLQAVARRNGVTVKELQAANNLTTTRITVGQKLRIPSKETAAPTP
jgi:LysM repeat protein